MHNLAQQLEIDVAIHETLAWRPGWLVGERLANARIVAAPGWIDVQIRPQTRKVRHQIANGNGALSTLKLGQISGDRIIYLDLALIVEFHDRGRSGDHFRQ